MIYCFLVTTCQALKPEQSPKDLRSNIQLARYQLCDLDKSFSLSELFPSLEVGMKAST